MEADTYLNKWKRKTIDYFQNSIEHILMRKFRKIILHLKSTYVL